MVRVNVALRGIGGTSAVPRRLGCRGERWARDGRESGERKGFEQEAETRGIALSMWEMMWKLVSARVETDNGK